MIGRRTILGLFGAAPIAARQTVAGLAGSPGAQRVSTDLLMYGATGVGSMRGGAVTVPASIDRFSPYGIALKALRLRDRRRDELQDAKRAVRGGYIHHAALPSWGAGKAKEYTVRHLVQDMEADRQAREAFLLERHALAKLHDAIFDEENDPW